MLRRATIRTRVLAGAAVPAVALVVVVALNLRRSPGLGVGVALVVVAAILVGVTIARSIARPIEVLTDQVADLSAMRWVEGRSVQTDELLPPRAVEGAYGGELGELAAAIATSRKRALRLIAEQREQHRTLRELAANSAQRATDVLAGALDTIDELSRRDHDPAAAASLSTVQRLVARADRHSSSVLVLLGEGGRVAEHDTALSEVVWAASLAVDAAERIDLVSLSAAVVRADAVSDLAHLLAEMLENSAHASGADQRVTLLGESTDVGYLLTLVDHGAGMDAVALAEANRRVARAVPVDQVPVRALGLDVVGRLARRHGIVVRLGESSDGGIVVRVEIPASLLVESAIEEPMITVDLAEEHAIDAAIAAEPFADDAADELEELRDSDEPGEPESHEVVEMIDSDDDVTVGLPGALEATTPVAPAAQPAATPEPQPEPEPAVRIEAPAVSVPSRPGVVIDPLPYVVRVSSDELLPRSGNRRPDELLPSSAGRRNRRWSAALARVGQ